MRLIKPLSALLLALATGCADARGVGGYPPEDDASQSLARSEQPREGERRRAHLDSLIASRAPRPDSLRALYLNGWTVGSRERMEQLIEIARETEINGFVIDIKESDSYLTYQGTGIPLALEIGADGRPTSSWLPELVSRLNREGVYTIARVVVFKDRRLAEKRPDLAIRHTGGGVWHDGKGKPWVNPYNREVWDYNLAIAREALEMGFAELQWDYVRFPDVPARLYRTMAFPGAAERSKPEVIRDFILYSKQRLAAYRVPVAADVFGLVTHVQDDLGIGQNWEQVISAADVVLPMVYPSHYYPGSYGFERPNARPYDIILRAMSEAVARTATLREAGRKVGVVVPWLQAFNAPWVDHLHYGPSFIRDQIQATYDAGLSDWILWHPGSRYHGFLPALRGRDGSLSEIEREGWKVKESTAAAVARTARRLREAVEEAVEAPGPSLLGVPVDPARRDR
ncbi:MAG: putative glycoside hydrolase [Longimicrobiaceae bacterium]